MNASSPQNTVDQDSLKEAVKAAMIQVLKGAQQAKIKSFDATEVRELARLMGFSNEETEYVLADSGATHTLVHQGSEPEPPGTRDIMVTLAGGGQQAARITPSGEVLIPGGGEELFPLGKAISILGDLELKWTSRGIELREGGRRLQVCLENNLPKITKKDFDRLRKRMAKKVRLAEGDVDLLERLQQYAADYIESSADSSEPRAQSAHIADGHYPYDSSCDVCRLSSGRLRRHIAGKAIGKYNLSVDMSGPFEVSGGNRYLLLGALHVPVAILKKQEEPATDWDFDDTEELSSILKPEENPDELLAALFDDAGGPDQVEAEEENMDVEAAESTFLNQEETENLEEKQGEDQEITVYFTRCCPSKKAAVVSEKLEEIINEAKTWSEFVRELRSDRGGEFANARVRRLIRHHGLVHVLTAPDDSQANSRAERGIGLVKERARRLLLDSPRPDGRDWSFAVTHASYLMRREVEKKVGMAVSPNLPRFGSRVVAQFSSEEARKTWLSRGTVGEFMGPVTGGSNSAHVRTPDGAVRVFGTVGSIAAPRLVTQELCQSMQDSGWRILVDPEGGEFYFNDVTKESTRTMPIIIQGESSLPAAVDDVVPAADEVKVPVGKPAGGVEQVPAGSADCVKCLNPSRHIPHNRSTPKCKFYQQEKKTGCPACLGIHTAHLRDSTCRLAAQAKTLHHVQADTGDQAELQATATEVPTSQVVGSMGTEKQGWIEAAQEELDKLLNAGLRELTPEEIKDARSRGVQIGSTTTVFTKKVKPVAGKLSIIKKVRCAYRGDLHKSGKEEEIFNSSSVPCSNSIRSLLAVAGGNSWPLLSADVAGAFLLAPIPDGSEFLIRFTGAMSRLGVVDPTAVYACPFAFYGRREAPRWWCVHRNKTLRNLKVKVGKRVLRLVQSQVDENTFRMVDERGELRGIICCYVDDLLLTGPDLDECNAMMAAIDEKLPLGQWGIVKPDHEAEITFCGLQISYKGKQLHTSQRKYIAECLKQRGGDRGSKVPGQESVGEDQELYDTVPPKELVTEAQAQVGELIWIASKSRPDIARATSEAAALVGKKPVCAIERCSHIRRYLTDTQHYALVATPFASEDFQRYENQQSIRGALEEYECCEVDPSALNVWSWSDASHAPKGQKSVGGSVILIGSMPVAW